MAHRLPEGDDCPHVYCRKQAWGRFLDIVYTEVTTLGCAPSEVGKLNAIGLNTSQSKPTAV
jgi:hypothetical protein